MSDGAVYKRTTGKGEVYYLDEISREWQHPWFVTGFYDESWKIRIKPGFVNGESPLATSDEVDSDGRNKQLPLTEFPAIPLPKDIFEQPPVAPKFFSSLGVKDPDKPDIEIDLRGSRGITVTIPTQDKSSAADRMLLKAVVFLTQARASHKLVTDIPGNLLLANLVEYSSSWDTSALSSLGRDARINVAKQLPSAGAPSIFDLFSGTIQDDSIDYLPLATLYFVSPPKGKDEPKWKALQEQALSDGPGAGWELYVKHDVFWNIDYANNNKPPINIPSFGTDPFTTFFVGRYTFAPMAALGAMNALVSKALAMAFNGASNGGRFWTV